MPSSRRVHAGSVKGRSVPARRVTSYAVGVRTLRHSLSGLTSLGTSMRPTRTHASEYSTMDTTLAADADASALLDGRHGRRKNVPAPRFAKMLSIVRRFIVCLPPIACDVPADVAAEVDKL